VDLGGLWAYYLNSALTFFPRLLHPLVILLYLYEKKLCVENFHTKRARQRVGAIIEGKIKTKQQFWRFVLTLTWSRSREKYVFDLRCIFVGDIRRNVAIISLKYSKRSPRLSNPNTLLYSLTPQCLDLVLFFRN
jgi:hypothetical protein